MKTLLNVTVSAVALFCIMAFAKIEVNRKEATTVNPIVSETIHAVTSSTIITAEEINIEVKDHTSFLNAIGHFESSNRYDIVNRFGYMGRYQFGSSTLKSLDINVSRKTFLNSPDLQEEAMDRLLTHNYKSLRKFINKYEGKYIHGVLITKSGVLAAAHLAGAGNVRKFFRKGYEFKDGNGTKMTSYMKVFSGYKLDI